MASVTPSSNSFGDESAKKKKGPLPSGRASKRAKKSEERQILVLPGKNANGEGLAIDEGDYEAAFEILLSTKKALGPDQIKRQAQEAVRLRKESRLDHFVSRPSLLASFHKLQDLMDDVKVLLNESYPAQEKVPVFREFQVSSLTTAAEQLKTLSDDLRCLETENQVSTIVKIRENDAEKRVWKVQAPQDILSLPNSVGQLKHLAHLDLHWSKIRNVPAEIKNLVNLEHLDLSGSKIRSIHVSIGNLKNLKVLNVSNTCVKKVPTQIGSLVNLEHFNLRGTQIPLLPESIGNLTNLKHLDLASCKKISELPIEIGNLVALNYLDLCCTNLTQLPEEIGNLVALEKLNVGSTGITSLPAFLGKLRNLQELDLSCPNLVQLTQAIGDLNSLKTLRLKYSKITSLASSIGRLENLEELDVTGAKSLSQLPNEIGALAKLKILHLDYSGVVSLPASFAKLKALMRLGVQRTPMQNEKILLMLAKRHPLLGWTGVMKVEYSYYSGVFKRKNSKKLSYKLACNRARFRTKDTVPTMAPKMWSLLIHNAHRSFDDYEFPNEGYYYYSRAPLSKNPNHPKEESIKEEYIYQLLLDSRESFVCLLLEVLRAPKDVLNRKHSIKYKDVLNRKHSITYT